MNVIGAPQPSAAKIIHPKLRYNFRVRFFEDSGTELSFGQDLSMQLISVSDITQTSFGEVTEPVMVFEDDVDNHCCAALQQLFDLGTFMIKIEYLDGNSKVLRTHKLTGCSVMEITHGFLDYADGSKLTKQALFSVSGMSIS